jgi:hypothetical protein
MDKVSKIYTKVAHAGVSVRATRRAASLIGALMAALVIGLVGTDAAQAVSVGPNGTLSQATADCTFPGQVTVHDEFIPAHVGQYYFRVRVWMYNFSTGLWTSNDWRSPQLGVLDQKIDYDLKSVRSGVYYLLTEWEQSQGNGWSQSIYDKVEQVFNWMPNEFSQNTDSLCAL